MHIGLVRMMTAQASEGMHDYARARELYTQLLKEDPKDADAAAGLATTLANLSLRHLETGKVAEARAALEEARTLREALVAQRPKTSITAMRSPGCTTQSARSTTASGARPPKAGTSIGRRWPFAKRP